MKKRLTAAIFGSSYGGNVFDGLRRLRHGDNSGGKR